jgi:Flp pilus assembly pilin Flp
LLPKARLRMRQRFWFLMLRLQQMMTAEDGQDLVEYALIAGLIAMPALHPQTLSLRLLLSSFNSITTTFDGYI